MQSMSVQTAQVSAAAAQIRIGSKNIHTAIETLEAEVAKLRGAWSGESQASYDAAQRKWTQSLNEMQSLLERIASSTEQIAQTYNQSDKRNAGRFAV